MKIYFAGSIRGGREDREIYTALIKQLQNFGTVLTEHIGDPQLTNQGEQTRRNSEIFDRDMEWVREADMIVAEVTTPSLGVGYEIGQAESMQKPIICFYRKIEGKSLSAMVAGNSYLKLFEYNTIEDVKRIVSKVFKSLNIPE